GVEVDPKGAGHQVADQVAVADQDLDAWVRMRIHHCGMSTVQLDSTGLMRLVSYNDTGHLPFPMVTS
ncbi:MAG: hypothetical protein AAFX99_28470, partial [Myxococcota bacterium]